MRQVGFCSVALQRPVRSESKPGSGGKARVSVQSMANDTFQDFARRYTADWCSHNPTSVSSFFAGDGSLAVIGQQPAMGRSAIADIARGFHEAVPDTVVVMDLARLAGDRAV